MNLKEGTRRLALLLGAVGAILGGVASYLELQTVTDQRARHNKFERLANSNVVQQERKSWSLTLLYTPEKAIEIFRRLPADKQRDVYSRLTQTQQVDLLAKLNCEPVQPGAPATAETRKNLLTDPKYPGWEVVPGPEQDDPYACLAEASDPPVSTVKEGGINTIHWTKDLAVESIEANDGQMHYPAASPSAWLYLLIGLMPAFGFVIPWGTTRGIGWVAAGFAGR